ncbi:MAG: leucine-rich repeat protein [Lachnospiraceae bacterium]|nr:leucine-rich repeat protein [Lachnospiraceae bacterium]
MEEQSFAYQMGSNGVCILRCYGSSARVVIPETLEGNPVTEVSAYAFAEAMEDEPENTSGLPCICGKELEELYLPAAIQRLGRYVFYNCLNLKKLSFYSDLAYMGAGAFTGCENLSCLEMHILSGRSCLREILQDLKQKVTVDCYQDQKLPERHGDKSTLMFRLVFPEFFEEAVENTPARIISTQTHGMGIQYRNAFRNTQVVFEEYDRLFETGKYNIDLIILAEMSLARLRYPYELEEGARQEYASWLSENLSSGAEFCFMQEDVDNLRWLAAEFVTEERQMELLLEAAKTQNKPAMVSMLMDVKHRRFPGKKRKFSL